MTTIEIEVLDLLNKHADHLFASFYAVNRQLNHSGKKYLQVKEIVDLCKFVREGKTQDNIKFPHLPYELIDEYGNLLRYPFSVLTHFMDFQRKTIKILSDVFNESRVFDFSWNYSYVLPVLRLFKNYVKLHIYFTQIPDFDKVPIVYGYVYNKKTNEVNEDANYISTFAKDRSTFRLLESELQIVNDHFFGLFKGIINILSRLLSSGLSFEWSLINISDNPSEFDETTPEFPFFKLEYICMIHLEELCESFLFYCFINMKIIGSDSQFADVLSHIVAHKPSLYLHGEFSCEVFKLFEDMRKLRNKRSDDIGPVDRATELARRIVSTREFRCRKLTMILNEFMVAAQYDESILSSKLIILLSIIGFSNFELTSFLTNYSKDTTPSIISLLYRMLQAITYAQNHYSSIERFLIFNFHEFDGPFLDTKIHSFHIPQTDYNRFVTVVQAFNFIDIEHYDNGTKYDLTGLQVTLKRIMASFNKFSTSNGVLHLSPLFNLISSIYFRVNLFVNGSLSFLQFAPLHLYWKFLPSFSLLTKEKHNSHSGHLASLFILSHFYSFDYITPTEYPEYKKTIIDFTQNLFTDIFENVLDWCKSLQNDSLASLRKQTDISVLLNNPEEPKEKQYNKLIDIWVSRESKFNNRQFLKPIYDKMINLSDTMLILKEIGTIQIFEKRVDVLTTLMKKMKNIMINLFENELVQSPFSLTSKIQTTEIIIEFLMTSAGINPSPIIFNCMNKLTSVPILLENLPKIDTTKVVGHISKIYLKFYKTFLTEILPNCFYSSTTQSFLNRKKKLNTNNNIFEGHFFASLSSLKTLYKIIGINGMASIDIISMEIIYKLYSQLLEYMNNNIFQSNDNIPDFISDPLLLQNGPETLNILCHIGAIIKFRELLHKSIPIEKAIDKYSFLNSNNSYKDDILIQQYLDKSNIIKIFKHPLIPKYLISLFSNFYWSNLKYNTIHDAFSNNSHLIINSFEYIISVILRIDHSFNYLLFYKNLLKSVYIGSSKGKENIERKLCNKWPSLPFILLLDHMIKNSKFIDYSNLEPIVSYKIIRSIYTIILGHQK